MNFSSEEGLTVSANGLAVYYRVFGSGRPLILLHGATDTHSLWEPFIHEFSESFRVFTPDSRGHGRTMNSSLGFSYKDLADDLAAFILALKLKKPFIFGYSDGGQAVLDFGMRYPGLAGTLVIGGAWFKFSEEYQRSIQSAGFMGPGEIDYEVFESQAPPDWENRMRLAHPNPDPNYPRVLLRNLSRLWWIQLHYGKDEFLKITAPTLILMGEMDEMIPLDEAREMAKLILNAALAIIPGVSHNDVLRSGSPAVQMVLKFLLANNAPDPS